MTLGEIKVLIGLYKENSPLKMVRHERIIALSEEAHKHGDELLIFSLTDVDYENKTVKAYIYDKESDKFQEKISPLPNVVINDAPKIRSKRNPLENKLREEIPFTCNLIGDKLNIYQKIIKKGVLSNYIIPTLKITDVENVVAFIQQHKKIIVKPTNGRQGKGLFKISLKSKQFYIDSDFAITVMDQNEFELFIENLIEQKNYICQLFIETSTKSGQVYDFRIHTQRNGTGKWAITKIYPRIGKEKSFLSNISQGGYTQEIDSFLEQQFSEDAALYKFLLVKLSLSLSDHINNFYEFEIDELGIDLAVDTEGNIWFYEANTGPQTRYHENKRAVNTIAYAKYLATKDNKKHYIKNKIPMIAMLCGSTELNNLKYGCAAVAKMHEVNFCYFSYKDIDFINKTIQAYLFNNGEWVTQTLSYENEIDVIYDRLRTRGFKKYSGIYKELENIPFNTKLFGNSISKGKLYNFLQKEDFGKEYLIDYSIINDFNVIDIFLDKYSQVILKPVLGSFGQKIIKVEKFVDYYSVIKDSERVDYTKEELEIYLTQIISETKMIVQRFIVSQTKDKQPFDIRVHMVKGKNKEWNFINIYPRIGINSVRINPTSQGGYIGGILGFLTRQYSKKHAHLIYENLKIMAMDCAKVLQNLYEEELFEIGIDVAIDSDGKLFFIEANLNKPGIIYYEFELAKHAIPYCLELINH